MELPFGRGIKLYTSGSGHMTEMTAMPIYGKNLLKIFFRNNSHVILKLDMDRYVLNVDKVYINDDPELTLTYFTTMSNLTKLIFVLILGPVIR